jgi:hypothetical protein
MSIASQSTQQKVPFPFDRTFDCLTHAISAAGLSVKSADKILGRITASAGMSLFSWGENLTFIVEKIDGESTLIFIESSLKFGANIAGAHRHQKNFNQVMAALSLELQKAA